MTTRIQTNMINPDHEAFISFDDKIKLFYDLVCFGSFSYEVVTKNDKIVEVKYVPVYELRA